MIKASDLRIGNRVLYKPYGNRDGEPVIIAGLMGMKAYFSKYNNEGGMFHHLQPIPITPDILQQFGFVDPANNGWGLRLYLNEADELVWYLQDQQFHGEARIKYQTRGSGFTRDFGIRYVHQLQNLFHALTGTELELKQEKI